LFLLLPPLLLRNSFKQRVAATAGAPDATLNTCLAAGDDLKSAFGVRVDRVSVEIPLVAQATAILVL
jgi:hypothetical protein